MQKKYCTYLLVILLLTAIGTEGILAQNRRSDKALQQASYSYLEGIKLQNLGTLRQAAQMYERAIKAVPEHAAAYYRLSGIARMINDPTTALEYARVAHQIDTSSRDYTDNYARMLTVTGDYAKADSIFSALLRRDPADIETQSVLAVLRLEAGHPQDAIQLVDSLEARAGGINHSMVGVKRQALIQVERYKDAYDYLTQVCEQLPGESSFHIQRAELAAALRYDSIALAGYKTAIDLDSIGIAPRMALAEYYRIKGIWPEFLEALVPVFTSSDFPLSAKTEYFSTYVKSNPDAYRRYFTYMVRLANAVLRSTPGDPSAQEFYAKHLIYSSQFDLAHQYLAEQIHTGKASLVFYRDVIEMAQFREQPDTVAKYIELARIQFPRNPELGMTILYTQFQGGDTLAAIATAREIIRYSRNDSITSSVHGFCGDMAHLRGDNKAAYRHYEKALKLLPRSAVVLNNFAYYLSEEGRSLERALTMSTRANELDPQNATYLDTKAWVLYQLSRYEEAQTVMRQALVLDDSKNPELLLHYGDILFALGKSFMAKTYWQRALEAGAASPTIEQRLELLNE